MSDKTDPTLFVKASPATHKRLAVLAAQLGIGKQELYRQAMRWASSRKDFKDAMAKVYRKTR